VGKDDKAAWDKDKAAIAQSAQQMHMQYPVLIDGDSIAINMAASMSCRCRSSSTATGQCCGADGVDFEGRY
jgi:hypothetical protein